MKASNIMELKIDQEFSSRLPKLNLDEYQRLEKNIIAEGCRDALVVWNGIILDGHNRYEICQKHNMPFRVIERQFGSRKDALLWIIDNQFAKRNLTTWQKRELIEERLKLAPEQSDRQVAQISGADHKTVGVARKRLEETGEIPQLETSVGADGKERPRRPKAQEREHTFNATNEKIEWAKWTWNPYTGCLGPGGEGICEYCYACDIANRFYEEKFQPTFRPERLQAPFNTKIPDHRKNEPGIRNVFVCSMGDLFGSWVAEEQIERVLDAVRRVEHEGTRAKPKFPIWNFIFLTKNPSRLVDIDWPSNAWVGTTVDVQPRVRPAEETFKHIQASVKFVSCEPFLEELNFNRLDIFDWVIVGGQSRTTKVKEFQPAWSWVNRLFEQARAANCKIYCKPNLRILPKEYPL